MSLSIFITGTDTGVGKTQVSLALIKAFNTLGYSTAAFKPIASGCTQNNHGTWVNEDAIALMNATSTKQTYAEVNPYAFKEPIAPHIAAGLEKKMLSATMIREKITTSIQAQQAEINIIEGAGGWALPINEKESLADVISALRIPVILVVGIRLGCLNHAILTSNMIQASHTPFFGWIANCFEPNMRAQNENINTLKNWLPAPYLGTFPYRSRI